MPPISSQDTVIVTTIKTPNNLGFLSPQIEASSPNSSIDQNKFQFSKMHENFEITHQQNVIQNLIQSRHNRINTFDQPNKSNKLLEKIDFSQVNYDN